MKILTVATRNRHKTGEIAAMLGPEWTVADLSERPDMPEPEETGATFEENAAIKALAATARVAGWVLADDSGLEVDLLGGAPGVYSARYAGAKAEDKANRDRLLAEIVRAGPAAGARLTARFRCAMAVGRDGAILARFTGSVEGRIVPAEAGTGGFGYDPLFVPDGFDETFAQLDASIKNRLSHRARAMEQVIAWLERCRLA